VPAYCYGTDNNLSFTRLIRCKDCQCSFHSECMMTISNEEDTSTCEPSCCYKCDELRKDSGQQTFARKGTLTKHFRSHTGERSFQCETCQQTFTRRDNLTRHLRSHTDERPFQCETCQQTFAQKVHLTEHIRCHTGERPFQCETCQQTFAQKGNLTKHIRSHTGERPFMKLLRLFRRSSPRSGSTKGRNEPGSNVNQKRGAAENSDKGTDRQREALLCF